MKQKPSSRRRRNSTKSILRLPDLEHAKAAVVNSLNSADAKRGYRHAIDEFVDWYCSEPEAARERAGLAAFTGVLESLRLGSLGQMDNLKTLQEIVVALEAAAPKVK